MRSRAALVGMLLLAMACGDGAEATSSGSGGAGGGASCEGPGAALSTDWCAHMVAGPGAQGEQALQLSAAHQLLRFFGPIEGYGKVDIALAAALEPPASLTTPDLAGYAAALPGAACSPISEERALGAASVTLLNGVAWVKPGMGAIKYPVGSQAVAVDLRGLPAGEPLLADALEAAIAPALASSFERPGAVVRHHDGMIDEIFSETNVYDMSTTTIVGTALVGTGSSDLPLVLLTEAQMPPEAVEVAVMLRLAGRASVFGEDLASGVAEARWLPIGSRGLAVRWRDLYSGAERWPDGVAADVREAQPSCLITSAEDVPVAPSAATLVENGRPSIKTFDPFGSSYPVDLSPGLARAALLVAHAAVSRFGGFPADKDDRDGRLLQTLATVDAAAPLDRVTVRDALRRFGHSLGDGHNFIINYGSQTAGYFIVMFEDIDGEAVVRRSGTPGVLPGDTIISIAGVAADQWYATELARTSAGSAGYRYDLATRYFTALTGPTEFGLRAPDNTIKTVVVTPQPATELQAFGFAASLRAAGPLNDLGAPNLYYLNVDGSVLTSAELTSTLQAAQSYAGLVLDMRGYPAVNHYALAQRLIQQSFSSPLFRVPVFDGPDAFSINASSFSLPPLSNPAYSGPIVLLVGHHTVSAAENFATMLVDADRVTVIGRTSASTNGNITGLALPGGFGFSFTGMEVQHVDGSPFNQIGIVPDIEVPLSAQAFAAGDDPELLAAIATLSN